MTFELSAVDLYGMAYLNRKRKIYGMPNIFVDIDRSDALAVLKEIAAGFVDRGIADLDMDGNISLRTEYKMMLDQMCNCEKYLTVTYCTPQEHTGSRIFWLSGRELLMAEKSGGTYRISTVDTETAEALIRSYFPVSHSVVDAVETVIPKVVLKSAAEACKSGNMYDCVRVLRQNGADERTAHLICCGLSGNANWLAVCYADDKSETNEKQSKVYVWTEDWLLEVERRMIGLRSGVAFVPVDADRCAAELTVMIDSFL